MYISMEQCVSLSRTAFKGVIHIGAHHGEEATAYEKCGVQNVLWVEGNPIMMKFLFDNVKNLSNKNVCLNEVVSDVDDEELFLNIANNGQSSSILELGTHAKMYPHIQYTNKIPVKTKTFMKILEENRKIQIENYDFLNIDVQGAELKVLKGFGNLLSQIKAIYTEVNFEEVYKGCCLVEEIDEYLMNFNFKRIATAAPEKTWGDSLYVRMK